MERDKTYPCMIEWKGEDEDLITPSGARLYFLSKSESPMMVKDRPQDSKTYFYCDKVGGIYMALVDLSLNPTHVIYIKHVSGNEKVTDLGV